MRVTRSVLAALLVLLLLAVPSAAAQANQPVSSLLQRSEPLDANYYNGYLAMNSGTGTIHWSPNPKTEDPAGSGSFQDAVETSVGWGLRSNTGGQQGKQFIKSTTFVSDALPVSLAINVSRVIQIDVFRPDCGSTFDTELYAGETFVGGALHGVTMDWEAQARPPSGWCVIAVRLHSEVSELPAGTKLTLRLVHFTYNWYTASSNPNAYQYGFKGDHASIIRIPFFSPVEAVLRAGSDFSSTTTDEEPASASTLDAASEPSAVDLLPILGLALAAPIVWRSDKRRALLLALLFLGGALAGCLGSAAETETTRAPQDNTAGSANATYVPVDEGSYFGENGSGAIVGLVHDSQNVPVADAHVSLLGTSFFTTTNRGGQFSFKNVSAGSWTLRVERASFFVFEGQVKVLKGQIARLDVSLVALEEREGDFRAHHHDYWSGQDQVTFLESQVRFTSDNSGQAVPACTNSLTDAISLLLLSSSNYICMAEVDLTPAMQNKLGILPGTATVEAKLNWNTNDNKVERAGIGVILPNERPDRYNRINTTLFYPRPPNEPTRIQTSWELTDLGHARYSGWRFFVYVTPNLGTSLDARASVMQMTGPFDLEIKIHRGVVPLEPAHRDFWGDNTTLPLLSDVGIKYQCTGACAPTFPTSGYTWTPVDLVPPETKMLQIKFDPGPTFTPDVPWALLYKSGNIPPDYTYSFTASKYTKLTPTRTEGRIKYYDLEVKAEETDGFYERRSNWKFALDDGQDQTLIVSTGQSNMFKLSVTAVRG